MMDLYEIKHIIDEIIRKKRPGDVNVDRLFSLMEKADFVPREIDAEQSLNAIKREARAASPRGLFSLIHGLLPRPGMLAGALAAVIAVPSIILYLWFFSPGAHSGRAVCSYVSGGVSMERDGRRVPLTVGMTLEAGDSVAAGGNSLADFTVAGVAGVRVMEKTKMTFNDLTTNTPGRLRFDADVAGGTVLFTFVKLSPGDEAFVRTPVSVAVVRGTIFGVRVDPRLNARYEVLSGRIAVGGRIEEEAFPAPLSPEQRDALTPVNVSANQACTVSAEGAAKARKRILEVLAAGGSVRDAIAAASKDASIEVFSPGRRDFTLMADMRNFVHESLGRTGSVIASVKTDGAREKAASGFSGESSSGAGVSPIRDGGSFNFDGWAAGREWSALAYGEADGMVIGVSKGGVAEAATRSGSRWSVNLGSSTASSVLLDENNVYFSLASGKILALSRKTGKTLWVLPLQGLLPPDSGITLHEGKLYAATSKGFLYRITPSGNADWVKKLDAEINLQPFAQGPSLFVMGNDGILYRLGVEDGEIKGTYTLGGATGGALDSRMNRLYLAGPDGSLVCFDHEKIAVLWRYAAGDRITHIPVADRHGVCLVTDSGAVHGIGLSGERRWKVNLGNRIGLRATLSGKDIYVVSDRALYLLDRHSGELKWSYVTETRPGTPIIVAGRNILFGAEGRGMMVMRR